MSIVDEDTARAFNSGKESIGAVLSTIQTHLQKVFIVFVIGFLGTFWSLRAFLWDWLYGVTTSQMAPEVLDRVEIIVTTPFEVILLQAKIGIVVGVIISIPPLLYFARHELRARGLMPEAPIARWKIAGIASISALLFVAGVAYAYAFFFPLIFRFLAEISIGAGVEPHWSIVMWTEFLVLLTISFGLAAQLPLVMSTLAYAEIVPYETFRDKWRYAVVGIFAFGALFSPPDPISQVLWAAPLVLLYGASLALTRTIVNVKRGASDVSVREELRSRWNVLLAVPLLAAAAVVMAIESGLGTAIERTVFPLVPGAYRPAGFLPAEALFGLPRTETLVVLGVLVFLAALVLTTLLTLYRAVNAAALSSPGDFGDPTAIDLSDLDEDGIRAAPEAAFVELGEDEALALAREAMESDRPGKAQAIFDRFDAAHEGEEGGEGEAVDAEAGTEGAPTETGEEPGVVEGTATGMLASFSEERDEDDIGGYIYDIKFILGTLRTRGFIIAAVFGVVLALAFTALYYGGLGYLQEDFVDRIPDAAIGADDLNIINLHPVEVLIFMIKLSTLAAAVATLPLVLYYAWPALRDRGLAKGHRSVLFTWSTAMLVAFVLGTMIGYLYIAPGVMWFLVADAVNAEMIISYRIESFAWLVMYTTVGVGLLACVPMAMWMLYRGRVASYEGLRERWREVTIAVFAIAGVFTPVGVLTMFLVAIPTMIAYWIGLIGLWFVTLGGRRDWPGRGASEGSPAVRVGIVLFVAATVLAGGAVAAGLFGGDDLQTEIPGLSDGDADAVDEVLPGTEGNDGDDDETAAPAEDDGDDDPGGGTSEASDEEGSDGVEEADDDGEPNDDQAPDDEGDGSDDENAEGSADQADDEAGDGDESEDDGENGDDEADDDSGVDLRTPVDDE
ncbi:twin-arginine translocase subunit TatC [Natronorarus salvus]|uniref:twin-arginine translocase subunit TatC n=1 Tax=Natronorarus salvus TaxID=3117733 RepID=UPI002F262CA5